MLDFFNLPSANGDAEIFTFVGSWSQTNFFSWQKPRGKSMINILLAGCGGAGGNGAVGAASTAAGGGGGGAGALTRVTMPVHFLPDILYIRFAGAGGGNCTVSIGQDPTINSLGTIAYANNGSNGGNASGATPGTAGGAISAATAGLMPLGWPYAFVTTGGGGVAGSATTAGTGVTLAGTILNGGCGGAGLGNAGSAGFAGGGVTGGGAFPSISGGAAPASSTAPPGDGIAGVRPFNLPFFYPGTGGGSSAGNATGAGLKGGNGGDGAWGCGGGGGGGALTGSTQGVGGRGGPGFCIITCW